jgi:hypothetical protein
MVPQRGTIIYLGKADSHREDLHYMGSKKRQNELKWLLTLRINSFTASRGIWWEDIPCPFQSRAETIPPNQEQEEATRIKVTFYTVVSKRIAQFMVTYPQGKPLCKFG